MICAEEKSRSERMQINVVRTGCCCRDARGSAVIGLGGLASLVGGGEEDKWRSWSSLSLWGRHTSATEGCSRYHPWHYLQSDLCLAMGIGLDHLQGHCSSGDVIPYSPDSFSNTFAGCMSSHGLPFSMTNYEKDIFGTLSL
ncbi:uncharacterized protein [Lolium perenne]|uniref:uncharacterized protein isoform X2 n=1 Tax=Lolium perenne TaxID=4522 RepID=UPI003A9A3AC3